MTVDRERDQRVLNDLDGMIEMAPEMGIIPLVFKLLKDEFIRIMRERDYFENKGDNS